VSGFVKAHPIVMNGQYAQVVYREYIISGAPKSELTMVTEGSEASVASE